MMCVSFMARGCRRGFKEACMRRIASVVCETVLPAAVCTVVVLCSVFHVSCRATEQGIQILAGDYESPVLEELRVLSAEQVSMRFSEPVQVSAVRVYPADAEQESAPLQSAWEYEDDRRTVVCTMQQRTQTGGGYVVYGEIKDSAGNTLSFNAPFVGFNDHKAALVLSELQDGKASSAYVLYEFVEVFVVRSGNLSGIGIESAYDGKDRIYRFPAVEVTAGDYITVHMRKDDESSCIDELEDDLTLAAGKGTGPGRDLWNDSESPCFGSSGDVILLTDLNDGSIYDAFLYSKSGRTEWQKPEMADCAQKAYEAGRWRDGCGAESAFQVTKKSSPYLFSRKTMPPAGTAQTAASGSDDWYMETPSKATPGAVNVAAP